MEAIKEASGSVSKVSEIYGSLLNEGLEEDFNILSGEDNPVRSHPETGLYFVTFAVVN